MGDNVRSDPMPEVIGGEAHFTSDADLIAAGPPITTVPDNDDPVVVPDTARLNERFEEFLDLDRGMLEGFRQIQATSERLRAKIEADQLLADDGTQPMHKRWYQAEDGTWFSAPWGPLTVVVERQSPADLPYIHVLGRMQEMSPSAARWLSLRLVEAVGIVETAVLP